MIDDVVSAGLAPNTLAAYIRGVFGLGSATGLIESSGRKARDRIEHFLRAASDNDNTRRATAGRSPRSLPSSKTAATSACRTSSPSTCAITWQRTIAVDNFEPNPWGLYNVHGNVWEWTEDCWNASNTGNPGDGRARTTNNCDQRVVRGGSWGIIPQGLRSAERGVGGASFRNDIRGFRLARTLNP